jgi:tRNA pseudouridine55 synthase
MDSLTDILQGTSLLVDKPLEWTSFDVVNKIRHTIRSSYGIRKIKVGHAGTLDPLATGLLIICTGRMTKQIENFQGLDKSYEGELILGATTPTYDGEMEIDETFPVDHIGLDDIYQAAQSFVGEITQIPPIYSALKKDGVPLYKLARAGKDIKPKARQVVIYEFNITSVAMPSVAFEVKCSKGTYIRSLANDLGRKLSSGAYLSRLRRSAIGKYTVKDAWEIDELVEAIKRSAHEYSR